MTEQLTFVLNGRREEVSGVEPTMTLLNYLRRKKRLTGTKEGCAEGDCGACTVAVGELVDGSVRYRPINACIQFLPMLHGKSVVTVEGLRGPGGQLHTCQEAIVETNASQCGFCTPGFVMSIYAFASHAKRAAANQQINDALAGNLCRCTGYGPLIDATRAALQAPKPDWDRERIAREADQLSRIQQCSTFVHGDHRCFRPNTVDELADLVEQHPEATIVAGATDVGLWVTKQLQQLPITIHIGHLAELRTTHVTDGKLWIGAGATYAEAEEIILRHYPDFGELVRRIGGVQVRSAGTIGGNIANGSPIGDTAPALIALGAQLILRKGGAQRRIPLEEFFIAYGQQDRAPGEFVEAIEVPLLKDPGQLRCYKVSKRFDQDISAVCGCINIEIEAGAIASARVAFGGMAGTPLRAKAVEKQLLGSQWSSATIENAIAAFDTDFQPISDMRASAHYRMLIAKNLLRRYFAEIEDPSCQTRLVGPRAAL